MVTAAAPARQAVAWERWALLAIFLLALLLRVQAVVGGGPLPGPGDAQEYDQIARDWLATGRYTTPGHGVPGAHLAIRTPGYPAFLAGLYWLAGRAGWDRFALLRPTQLLLDLASLLLLYRLGRRLFGRRVALLAAGCFALYPPFLQSLSVAMTETVSVLLVLATASLLVAGMEGGRARSFILAGACAGLATLVRPLTQLVGLPVLVLAAWAAGGKRARGWLCGAAFALALALTISPWLVRNRVVFGRPAPLATFGGMNFFTGNYLPFHGFFRAETYGLIDSMLAGRKLDEVQVDAVLQQAGWSNIARYLRHQPLAYAELLWGKFRTFWEYYYHPTGRPVPWPLFGLGEALHRALLLLALPGALLAGLSWRRTWPVLLLPAYLCLLQVAVIAEEGRYNIIAMPLLMLLAAHALTYLLPRTTPRPLPPS